MTLFKKASVFILLFVLGLFLNKLYHSVRYDPIFTYHSELWADRGGYYVYLPAFFVYDLDVNKMPEGIEQKVGSGFWKDNGKIFTKYPIGVAYFESPFYALATLRDKMKGDNVNDGFTRRQHIGVLMSGIFWGLCGIFILYELLRCYARKGIALFVCAAITLGTNLLYYMLVEPGMSHIYSFLLFTSLLLLIKKWKDSSYQSLKYVVGIAICIGLIAAVRQFNIVFAGILLLAFESNSFEEVKERALAFFKPKALAAMVIIPFIILLPQMAYYYYLFGKPFMYSYTNEGFDNWASPKIIEVLFAPQNGLFTWNPILLIPFIAMGAMIALKAPNRWAYTIVLLLVVYSYASWHCWYLGCSFGSRGLTDFMTIFALLLTWALVKIEKWKSVSSIFYVLIVLMIFVNLRLMWNFDFCYFGEGGSWDWSFYKKILNL